MSRAFRRDHSNINIGWRENLRVMQTETMGSHEHLAGRKSWPNITLKDLAMMLVGNKDHDYIGLFSSICRRHHAQSIGLSLFTALTALGQSDDDITAIVTHIKCMSVALAAITNDGNTPLLDEFQVCV
jgi:hypothetical protein